LRDVLRLKKSRKNSGLKENNKQVREVISNNLKDCCFTVSTSVLNRLLSNTIQGIDSLRDVLRFKKSRKNSGLKENNKHVISNSLRDVMLQVMDKVSGPTM